MHLKNPPIVLRTVHTIAFLVIFLASLGLVKAVEARDILPGYGKFAFGMTEAELRNAVAISYKRNRWGQTWLETKHKAMIDGVEYELSFLLTSGNLHRIHLVRSTEESRKTCRLIFERLVQELSSRYGAPDSEPQEASDDSGLWVDTAFTFDDGSRIAVSMASGDFGTCGRYLSFQSSLDAAAN